jgi:cytochrome c peroxidase
MKGRFATPQEYAEAVPSGKQRQTATRGVRAPNDFGPKHTTPTDRRPQADAVRQVVLLGRAHVPSQVRTIRSGDSAFDRHRAGDASALTSLERQGMQLFFGKARCGTCHSGPLFTDERFHNTGVAFRDGAAQDSGRFAVTSLSADLGAFKTPTLRDVTRTAPYMHDGSLPTLEAVVDFYDRGGMPNPQLDRLLQPLGLAADERSAVVAFLGALNGVIREGRW